MVNFVLIMKLETYETCAMLAIRLNSKRIIASHAQKICMTTITGGAKNLLTGGVGREGGKVSSNKGKSMCHSFIIIILFLSDFLALFLSSSSSSPFFFFFFVMQITICSKGCLDCM